MVIFSCHAICELVRFVIVLFMTWNYNPIYSHDVLNLVLKGVTWYFPRIVGTPSSHNCTVDTNRKPLIISPGLIKVYKGSFLLGTYHRWALREGLPPCGNLWVQKYYSVIDLETGCSYRRRGRGLYSEDILWLYQTNIKLHLKIFS